MLSKVIAKNFQSWSDLVFEVQNGVTLIDGFNEDDQTSEGSGKSSILNAISWCIYGKIPKDAKVDDVIKHGESKCIVALEMSNGDVIYRSRKPNDLLIKKSDGFVIKGKDAKETQELIEEYVGSTFETFCQSVYFAQNYDKKFLSSNQEEKGKILSGIQNLSIFDKARNEVMSLLKIENSKLLKVSTDLDKEINNKLNIESKINMLNRFIEDKQRLHLNDLNALKLKLQLSKDNLEKAKKLIDPLNEKLCKLQQEIGGDSTSVSDLETQILSKKLKQSEVASELKQIGQYNNTISSYTLEGNKLAEKYTRLKLKKDKLEEFINNPSKICPSCGSEVKNLDLSHSLKEMEELDAEMNYVLSRMTELAEFLDKNPKKSEEDLNKIVNSLTLEINSLNSSVRLIKSKDSELTSIKNSILTSKLNVDHAEKRIIEDTQAIENFKSLDISKEMQELKTLEFEFSSKLNTLESLNKAKKEVELHISKLENLKDGFKEIKSFVFNNALNELNHKVNEYLNSLFEINAKLKFTTEDQKIETTIILNDRETSLGLLSGGQNRRFNLAVDLAISDIVSSRNNSILNILILDEYFRDLSEQSMEKCLNLLSKRPSPVIIIEHNSLFKNIVNNSFFVGLKNGTSYEISQ